MSEQKKKGVVDFVLLVDATGSMSPCMGALKESLGGFLSELTGPQSIVQDWRGKVVAFRDVGVDGSKWFEDGPFVREAGELRTQLDALKAMGGGNEPESLLDAIHKLASSPVSPKGGEEEADKWRTGVTRCVVAFTDATCHPTMAYEGGAGGTVTDVINALMANKIVLILFGPDDPSYDELISADRAEHEKIPGPDFVKGMEDRARDKAAFTKTMKAFAKTITASSAVEVL